MRLYFSWVLFFYGVLIAPVLLISWCFSEPFSQFIVALVDAWIGAFYRIIDAWVDCA